MSTRVLVLPGIGDSGTTHWQSLWEAADPSVRRIRQRDWERPQCREWLTTLEEALRGRAEQAVLAAHSLGCLLAVHGAESCGDRIKGALLVARPIPKARHSRPMHRGSRRSRCIRCPFPALWWPAPTTPTRTSHLPPPAPKPGVAGWSMSAPRDTSIRRAAWGRGPRGSFFCGNLPQTEPHLHRPHTRKDRF